VLADQNPCSGIPLTAESSASSLSNSAKDRVTLQIEALQQNFLSNLTFIAILFI
jgi:hypothetical protein